MEFKNAQSHLELLKSLIDQYGYGAEHHVQCYLNNNHGHDEDWLVTFDDGAILTRYDAAGEEWSIFAGILAKKERRAALCIEFLNYIFDPVHAASKPVKKVWVEFETEFRKELTTALKSTSYRANRTAYSLTWPVFDMTQWNGQLMQGKEWKDMRYYWNKFFKEHTVEFKPFDASMTQEMLALIDTWKKQRTTGDKTYTDYYEHTVRNGFVGFNTRIMIVDGKIGAITAGFTTPRNNGQSKNYYYSSIGIYDRMIERIGEVANMDDLIELKKQGYELVDFGGGEDTLTTFKKKFHPHTFYDTHIFSIVKKKDE